MIYQPTKLIEQVFIENNIHCQVAERGQYSVVQAGFNGKNIRGMTVHFISVNDANDVAVRILGIATVHEERRAAVMEMLNDLNIKYRFVKFVLAKDGGLSMECDVPVKVPNVGEVCMELLLRVIQIADEVYPEIMRAVWA